MAIPAKDDFSFPGPVPKEAVDYIGNKGWKVGFDYRDVWREEHAAAFTVAKAMNLDVLEAIRGEVERAIQEGRTFADFQKDLQPALERLGWWGKKSMVDPVTGETRTVRLGSPRRLKTIYDTNLRTARAAGQWQRIERTKKLRPYLLWVLGPSREHRPEHVAWNGTLLPVDDPWWDAHNPPCGWGCKCRIRQVGKSEADRMKRDGVEDSTAPPEMNPATGLPTGHWTSRKIPVKTAAPEVRLKDWVNKRTGKVERVPEGVDPGWDVNPGKQRLHSVDRLLAGKLEAADYDVAQTALRDIARSDRFADFVKAPVGEMPVLRLMDEAADAIGAKQRVAVLSTDTMLKQLGNHADLGIEDYRMLPELGANPDVIVQDGENTVVVVRQGKKAYWAAVKATQTGESMFVTSFRRTHPSDVDALLKKGRMVYGDWK